MRDIWNDIPNNEKTGIRSLRLIAEPTTKKDARNLGQYSKYEKSIEVTISNLSSGGDDAESISKKTKSVILHEIGHSKFDSYDDELKQKWSDEVLNYKPISGYLKKFKAKVTRSKNKLNGIIDEIEQQKKDWVADIDKFQKQIDSGKLSTDKDVFGNSKLDIAKDWVDKGNKAIKALDEEKLEYQKEHNMVVQSFGNETHSEFTVLKNGVETFWKQDNSVYNELKPIYDKIFGGKK